MRIRDAVGSAPATVSKRGTSTRSFGAQLKAWRARRGMTQRELATKTDIAPSYVSKLERGRVEHTPSVRTIRALANALDVDELEVATAANKLGTGFPVFVTDASAVEFFKAATQQARSSADWERLTAVVRNLDNV